MLTWRDVMQVSEVRNGVLELLGLSSDEMMQCYKELSYDIMQREVPHFRVIGVKFGNAIGNGDRITDKAIGLDKSYVELFSSLQKLVYAEGGGIKRAPDNSSEVQELLDEGNDKFAFLGSMSSVVESTNGSIVYLGCGNSAVAKAMVKSVPVVRTTGTSTISIIAMRSTGIVDFPDATAILKSIFSREWKNYIPVRAVYDLNKFVVLKPYVKEDGNCLHFMYKYKCDESVLTRILQDYAQEVR